MRHKFAVTVLVEIEYDKRVPDNVIQEAFQLRLEDGAIKEAKVTRIRRIPMRKKPNAD